MCIVLWSTSQSSNFRLIVASNRDESLDRPSLRSQWHRFDRNDGSHRQILSGRDLIGRGTWLAIQRDTGRFGFITNVTAVEDGVKPGEEEVGGDVEGSNVDKVSRGRLIRDYLMGDKGIPTMDGFNLLLGKIHPETEVPIELSFYSNRQSTHQSLREFEDDDAQKLLDFKFYGFSNSPGYTTSETSCPSKVLNGIRLLKNCLRNSEEDHDEETVVSELLKILSQTEDSSTELSDNIFIKPFNRLRTDTSGTNNQSLSYSDSAQRPDKSSLYGTRTQTLILVSDSNTVTFVERNLYTQTDFDEEMSAVGCTTKFGAHRDLTLEELWGCKDDITSFTFDLFS
ncbi:NRDE protein-domain-containing protein [Phakopsora pachyrhizi]|nr:NRDE protein-domain-containing protein [Phakopsora pachyrhizi]